MDNSAQIFSFFHIVIRADTKIKPHCPITRNHLYYLIRHFCELQKSEILSVKAFDCDVHLIIKLNGNVALGNFMALLMQWTSFWIIGLTSDECSFWEDGFWLKTLSPEDKSLGIAQLEAESFVTSHALPYFQNTVDSKTSQANCHHIIFTTARNRLIMPTKFRLLLYEAIRGTCAEIGGTMIDTASTRNHIHLLCYVPFFCSLVTFYNELRQKLTHWMHSNIHFRRVDELSTQFLAFSVSEQDIDHERHLIAHQDEIHYEKWRYTQLKCEEQLLYERLGLFTHMILK